MTDNRQAIATQPSSPDKSSPPLDRANEVLRLLVPIRPVGMNDEAASDWVAVIVADTLELSDKEFLAGCRVARAECDDHRQVRKCILGADDENKEFHRKLNAIGRAWAPTKPRLGGPRSLGQIAHESLIGKARG